MHILLNSGTKLRQSAKESIEEHLISQTKNKLLAKNMARDEHGPEFDDRLINLVRENAAIYDVSHPHYRRTPVRMAIWENIARELGAPSRYLQTKWKNIRYNYLQEQKCLETGILNANIRRRRFTADLTFLKHTAYRRDSVSGGTGTASKVGAYHGNENENNTVMYPDNFSANVNNASYEVIELDQSDDEYMPDVSAFLAPMKDMHDDDSPHDPYAQPDVIDDSKEEKTEVKALGRQTRSANIKMKEPQHRRSETPKIKKVESGVKTPESNRSSPLLTPMTSAKTENLNGNNDNNALIKNGDLKLLTNGNNNGLLSEVTIRPVYTGQQQLQKRRPSSNLSAADQSLATKELQLSNSINHDPIELYCLSLVDCFRAMPRSERERVKFEFSKILKDAQYTNQS